MEVNHMIGLNLDFSIKKVPTICVDPKSKVTTQMLSNGNWLSHKDPIALRR
jgi:hypothetical protein